jgi:ectoine hydroxylase
VGVAVIMGGRLHVALNLSITDGKIIGIEAVTDLERLSELGLSVLPIRGSGTICRVIGGLVKRFAGASLSSTNIRASPRRTRGNTMKLTQQQIDDFHREGWLFLPELFRPEEVALLAREAVNIYDTNRPEVWREKSGAPRTAFAAHLYNEAFGLLGAHPRMIDPVEQIFNEKVYMHQYKINAKSAFTGDVWQWHQDYGTWKRDDGMSQPKAMNIAVFLDEVMHINGPLMLVPRSQHAGDLKASHDLETTSYPLWTLDEVTVTRLVNEGGIVAPTGKAGGMLMFHGNLVHGSAGNITPYPRKIVYLTLNAVSNYIRTPTRPDYIAHRDFTPIQTVDDDALLRLARAQRQAAE